ncbi:MAG: class I SAM-dependent methyltransferase [Rhodospirillaceae bacterium]|jgi:ubiquinone/menaquinone biosynthesis C-methylase UbiE|nr:class I SAM-dependent methyltransferase [Rhodospirillaceae bacterium]MBT5240976.1 class I SAM-dependent methyltransferase [Rhodospirillaceae bacterium]MBT5564592.1 class I SAM-dependent methyltransferase [Rhodospirillaceae bacterium]MBT6090927.1 class I SAM-dependent methyltransferase [Rhodospirillaceae bacterium]MBT6960332.1 class I SAM-dependent methyltransferase [Rhodospirillaceae bacterium]
MLPLPDYDFLPTGTHDEEARENFCRGLAIKLAADIRPPLKTLYEAEVKPAFEAEHRREPSFREIAKEMRKQTRTQLWYRMRTDNQDRMYAVTGDMISRQATTLTERAIAASGTNGSLTLDSSVAMPRYLTEVDIHRKPGGYHLETIENDISPGAQYERTIAVHNMGSQGINNDDPAQSIATWIRTTYPDLKPMQILDLGCTIGNNTLPYKSVFPEAKVFGVDVSAPCLRYAHARACALGTDVHFHQADAQKTGFADNSFDVIVSRILLHETSAKALPGVIQECHRLLKPGGLMLHCDAPQFDALTPYQASLRDWDATCNNEPFMLTVYDMSLKDLYSDHGFLPESYIQTFVTGLYIKEQNIDPNATPGFGASYFVTGAIK